MKLWTNTRFKRSAQVGCRALTFQKPRTLFVRSQCSSTNSDSDSASHRLASESSDFELQDYAVSSSYSTHQEASALHEESGNFFSRTWARHRSSETSFHSKNSLREHQHRQEHKISKNSKNYQQKTYQPSPTLANRVWQQALHTVKNPCEERFIVTSFNILASANAHQHRSLYPYVPDAILSWSSRKIKILEQLDFACPDVICLQEVDQFNDLQEDLSLRGYVGLYKVRTGDMLDGCAIFWKKGRFRLLQERSFEFSTLGMRNNVAQLCVLQLVTSRLANITNQNLRTTEKTCVVVGNIHVLFNPKRGEIKLGQCRAFLEQVHNMSSIWQGAPVVIGGDFNSTPSSAIYKFLAESQLDVSNLDRRFLSGQVPVDRNISWNEPLERPSQKILEKIQRDEHHAEENIEKTSISACSGTMKQENINADQFKPKWDLEELRVATGRLESTLVQHNLNLCSVYSEVQGQGDTRGLLGEPILTTCHKDFTGTVDYIWRNDGLKTFRVLDTVPLDAFVRNKGLPIKLWGSDHLPISCELAFSRC